MPLCYHFDMSQNASPAGSKVRVRFAPSPTGHVHVGNARTALFNWLFARQQGGTMILRIEDTDVERSQAHYETQLMEDLKWLGLDWDEGPDKGGPFPPYRQSDKTNEYREIAEKLVADGKAYDCFCTQEELEAQRELALKEHRQPIYPGTCRNLDPAEALKRKSAGAPCAIRLKIPERPIRFHDIVRGAVEFSNEVVSDPIIVRSTGIPVYNYVVVIDDADMQITHVIRGDDHLSNTPKQVAVYEALGYPVPEFAHLSTILGPDRERLSKRHGATSVANFRDMGVLPEALMNYMALLGWAPSGGDREIFRPAELVKEFDLHRVTPSPAVFDFEKLYWLNRHYIKEAMADPAAKTQLVQATAEFLRKAGYLGETEDKATAWVSRVLDLFGPAVNKLDELPEKASLLFKFDPGAAIAAPDNAEVMGGTNTPKVLDAFAAKITSEAGSLTAERFKAIINEVKTETGVKGKDLFHPIRIALTGSHSGPEFDKLVPLMEEGAQLQLPQHVMGVKERVEAFQKVRRR
jgi:glutamyl-tRNA synthetase/nondiscriminating glutamyl-tRNA synthetase